MGLVGCILSGLCWSFCRREDRRVIFTQHKDNDTFLCVITLPLMNSQQIGELRKSGDIEEWQDMRN